MGTKWGEMIEQSHYESMIIRKALGGHHLPLYGTPAERIKRVANVVTAISVPEHDFRASVKFDTPDCSASSWSSIEGNDADLLPSLSVDLSSDGCSSMGTESEDWQSYASIAKLPVFMRMPLPVTSH